MFKAQLTGGNAKIQILVSFSNIFYYIMEVTDNILRKRTRFFKNIKLTSDAQHNSTHIHYEMIIVGLVKVLFLKIPFILGFILPG